MRSLENLRDQPGMGRAVPDQPLRVLVTTRYRYAIVYEVTGDALYVRAIYHPRQKRPY